MNKKEQKVYWQFHQSTNEEMPQNTMEAFLYAWELGGIPELDIRTTKDGVIIAFHDDTPARTACTDEASKNRKISEFTLEEIKEWDAGAKLREQYKGIRVPTLEETFQAMTGHPDRLVYLDLKDVDLTVLAKLIKDYGMNRQVIFTHNNQQNCIAMKQYVEDIPTMLWIGGKAEAIKNKFNTALQNGFEGLSQVQLHLNDKESFTDWRYQLEPEFIRYAVKEVSERGLDLEVLPYQFDKETLYALLDMGIYWYAVDEPKRFISYVAQWREITVG